MDRHFMSANRGRASGFSLVEMLVVIVIVSLLVAVLVPAVGSVRKQAKVTTTKATLGTLSTGLETFKADQRIGGAYPPSASDAVDTNNRLQYTAFVPRESPATGGNPDIGPATLTRLGAEVSGGSLLVWALAGADLLGCPGFKPPAYAQFWSQATTQTYHNGQPSLSGLYALYPQGHARFGQPYYQRVSPFVDLGKVRVTPYDKNHRLIGGANTGAYAIEAEVKAVEQIGLAGTNQRRTPFFLDAFGQPILYWRADIAGTMAADVSPDQPLAGAYSSQRGTYHFLDNGALLAGNQFRGRASGPGTKQNPLLLRAKSSQERPHNLVWADPVTDVSQQAGFIRFIQNKNVTAKIEASNPQSYLLLSAGADGNFGTADDIANFEHNGAELVAP